MEKQDVLSELGENYSSHPPSSSQNKVQKDISILVALVVILRPFMSSIAAIVAVTIYFITSQEPIITHIICLYFTVFLTSGFGFVINDYFDIEKDKIDHKNRVLPRSLLSLNTVFRYFIIIGFCSLLFSFIISLPVFILNLLTLLLLSIYSIIINNKNGIIANIIPAMSSAFVLLFGMLAGQMNIPIFFLSFVIFFMIWGREIVLDIRDIISDRSISKISVPITLGIKNSILISSLLFTISSVIIILLSLTFGNIWFKIFIGGIFNIILWVSFSNYIIKRSKKSLNFFLFSTRLEFIPLILGILL